MGKHSVKTSKKKGKFTKRQNINRKIKISIIIIIILIMVIITKKANKKTNTDEISLIINNQNVTTELENEIIIQDEITYLSFNDIKKCIDQDIYQEEDTIIASSDKKIAVIELNNNTIEINGSNVEIEGQAFKNQQDVIYLPISELRNVYDMEFSYIENSKNITIDYYANSLVKAFTTKNISVKSEMKTFSSKVEKVKKGNWVIYVSEENGWSKVRTQNGNIGYIKTKYLTNFVTEREEMKHDLKNADENYLEKDITKENIEKYENRKLVIEDILLEVVTGNYKTVKIKYNADSTKESFQRLKIEAVTILKECGITVVFE